MLLRRDLILNSKLLDKFVYFVHLNIHDDLKQILGDVQSEIDLVGVLGFYNSMHSIRVSYSFGK